jgi:hypothetical protein
LPAVHWVKLNFARQSELLLQGMELITDGKGCWGLGTLKVKGTK